MSMATPSVPPFVPPAVTTPADFEHLFESAPVSLWLEDYSALKTLFDTWRAQGIQDFKSHVTEHPELLAHCSACFKVLKVNQKTLDVLGAASQGELVARLP